LIGGALISVRALLNLLFRRDITELNTFTWNGQGAINSAQSSIAKAGVDEIIKVTLNYGKVPGQRSDTLVGDARRHLKNVDNGIRLATVVGMASVLELFVRRIITVSLKSDPGLLISRSRAVDGVSLLKSGNEPDVRDRVKDCTEGTWSSRENAIHIVFGARVKAVFDNI
jgi:hypothetical protein